MDAASVGAWMTRTPWKVSMTCVNGSTPGDIGNSIGIVETSSPYLIVIIVIALSCGLNLSPKVGDIRKSNSPDLVR